MTTSPRARGVRALAHQLSTATGTPVEASYEGPRDGPWGGWQLAWSGGPDAQEMHALARTCPIAQPDGAALEGVRFERSPGSDEQTASALLAWLASHPDQGDRLPHLDDDELPGHPDRLDAATRYRAATLVTAGWRYRCAGPVADELARRARRGWGDVASWLDTLGRDQDGSVLTFPQRP